MKFFAPIAAAFSLLVPATSAVKEETKSLDELYAEAVAEGGKLVFYHGGDLANQQDALKAAFEEAFPGVNMTMVVDYSKYHDVRIDNQIETDTLIPDITALQTVQNFPRWAKAGDLLEYKPANFSKIYESLKDENGAWLAYGVNSFSYIYDSSNLGGLDPPTSPADLVDPQWAGKIASSYPHDDDAVLFVYHLYVQQYGWDWAAAMANQSISFNRGSHVANNLVTAQEKVIGVGTYAGAPPIVYVGGNGTEYLTWGQRLAILAKAKNPAAAKLFMNWIVSTDVQESVVMETVRTDVASSGSSHPWEIPEANLDAFPTFMANRTYVEALKQTFALYFGEVQGEPTPGYLGVHPGL
jgi:ABC-type Fe3+ transport system substrate-binding protein